MNKQIDSLTGLRGIAAVWIAVLHGSNYVSTETVLPKVACNIIAFGWLGVDMFFILSGFIISYVHQTDFVTLRVDSYIRFLKLRLARIYPAHFATTLLLVPIVAGAIWFSLYEFSNVLQEQHSLSRLVYSLLLINGWGFSNSIGWNVPSWSVGSEWFAYLCFPFIAFVFNRIRSLRAHILIIFSVFALMISLAIFLNDMQQYMLCDSLMLTRVTSEFIIGCSLYSIYQHFPDHVLSDIVAFAATILIIVLAVINLPAFYQFLMIGSFAILILSLSHSVSFAARLFSLAPLLYLGRISYSVYLCHGIVLIIVNQLLARKLVTRINDTYSFVIFFFVYIFCFTLVGHILYVFVERPARSFLRRRYVDI